MIRLAALPLVLLLVAAGCRTTQPLTTDTDGMPGPMTDAGYAELDELFTLDLGSSTVVDGMIVRFDHITEDSRCPADPSVSCVWEGRATVVLSLIAGDIVNTVQLSIPGFFGVDTERSDMQSAVEAGYQVSLLQLDPYPGQVGVGAAMTPMVTLRLTSGG